MRNTKGKLIVFEGIDGSGKATQAALLEKFLLENKYSCATVTFPSYDTSFFGALTKRYLDGEFGLLYQVDPHLVSLIYAGNRLEVKGYLEYLIQTKDFILCDRYFASNTAFQSVKLPKTKQKQFIDWITTLEYDIFKIPKEDLIIFLDMPVKSAQQLRLFRKKKKSGSKKDINESSEKYLKDVDRKYKELAKAQKNWVSIKCLASSKQIKNPIEIHKEIVKALKKRKIFI